MLVVLEDLRGLFHFELMAGSSMDSLPLACQNWGGREEGREEGKEGGRDLPLVSRDRYPSHVHDLASPIDTSAETRFHQAILPSERAFLWGTASSRANRTVTIKLIGHEKKLNGNKHDRELK